MTSSDSGQPSDDDSGVAVATPPEAPQPAASVPAPPRAAAWGWTDAQRRVIAVGLLALAAVLAVRLWRNPTSIPDPQPAQGARHDELADRLDPNSADWPALAVLPGIGESRARDIVEYRQQYLQLHPGERAFERPEDLLRIKGIGPALLEGVEPYLEFPPQ